MPRRTPRCTCQPGRPFGRRLTLDFEWKIYFWIYLYRYWIRRYTFIIETNRLTERGAWPLILSNIDRFAPNLPKSARFGDFESEFAPVMHYLIKQKDKRFHDVMKISNSKIRWWQRWSKRLKNLNFRSTWRSSSSHLRFISSILPDWTGLYRILVSDQSYQVTAELRVS